MRDDEPTSVRVPFTVDTVLEAYRHGIFPMGEGREIAWYCPDPRAVIPLDGLHVSRSLRRLLRGRTFEVTYDKAFGEVMDGCADGRPVWITPRIKRLYLQLHRLGHAHSVEVWNDGKVAGGLYGVQIGGAFMAESKFHRVANASKVALAMLVERLSERGFRLLEVQYLTDHLRRLGAVEIPLATYLRRLRRAIPLACRFAD